MIGLKIIGFFEQAGHSRSRAFTLNVWYALGILLVFATLALMSVGLSSLFPVLFLLRLPSYQIQHQRILLY